jgi:hypothetical protein
MAGYTDDAVIHHGILDSGGVYLQKPITPTTLTRKAREALDRKNGNGRQSWDAPVAALISTGDPNGI